MTQRQTIVDVAMGWNRTPYHHNQRLKGVGVDCAQLLIGVFSDAGLIDEFQPDDYPSDWMLHRDEDRFRALVRQYADEITSDEIKPGDVALYKVGRCFAHGAIVINWPVLIHADCRFGKVTLAEGDGGWLAGRPVEFYRIKGVPA